MRVVAAVLVLGTLACAVSDPARSTRTTQLWSGAEPDFSTGDISPDGRYFSDTDWDTGDLQIVDLETGQVRMVTGKGYGAGRYAWTSSFSTNGQRVAVSWYLYGAGAHELRVMNVDGTASRVLLPADEGLTWVDPLEWSPADETLLVALGRAERVWQIGLVSLVDGSVRVLKTLSWLAPGGEQSYPRASFSPDGRYIAYDYRPDLEKRARSIFALAVDGSGEAELVSGPGVNRFMGWFPDGRAILFYGERSGTSGIWRLPVRDGSPIGEPELVHSQMPALYPLGFTPAGFAYGVPDEGVQVHTATVDLEAGQVLEPPHSVDDIPSRLSLAPDWSPDGDHLAYVIHAPQPNAVETLVVRTVSGEVVETVPLSPTVHTSSATLRWIRDNTIVLFGMVRGRSSILRMDPRDGSFSRLPERVTDGAGNLKWFGLGPEGHTLYFVLPPKGESGTREIVARDARTGEERVLTTARTDHRTLAVSPAGDKLAYVARAHDGRLELRTTATSGAAETQTLYRASPEQTLSPPVAWAPDGSRVLFVIAQPNGDRALSSIAADGHDEPVRLEGSAWCCASANLQVHPDGRRITMIAGRDRGSIWLLEGF